MIIRVRDRAACSLSDAYPSRRSAAATYEQKQLAKC